MDNRGFNFMQENDSAMQAGPKDVFGRAGYASQGYSPMDNGGQGFDNNVEAKLSILSNQFKGSSQEHRRAVFNEAFRTARKAGLKEFELGGQRYTTELKEEKEARTAKHIAKTAIEHIARNEGVVHDSTKKEFDLKESLTQAVKRPDIDFAGLLSAGRRIPIPEATLNYERSEPPVFGSDGSVQLPPVEVRANREQGFGGLPFFPLRLPERVSQPVRSDMNNNSTADILRRFM